MIEVKGITKIYGKRANQFQALDDVSFDIVEGTSLAILGKSGSGKSTLMHIVSGLDSATRGEVLVRGRDLTKLRRREMDKFRAQEMGFVFQSFFVQGNESCCDNVSLPLEIARVPRRKRRARVIEALRAVELEDKLRQKAKNLSGGQKQRLAIARAIVNKPSVLFADEPTGNLDSVTGAVVEQLLFDYVKQNKATLIVVTHDAELAGKCDKQIHLKDGHIIEAVESQKGTTKQPTKIPLGSKRVVQ